MKAKTLLLLDALTVLHVLANRMRVVGNIHKTVRLKSSAAWSELFPFVTALCTNNVNTSRNGNTIMCQEIKNVVYGETGGPWINNPVCLCGQLSIACHC